VLQPFPGGQVGNLTHVDALPYVLAGLLVALAAGAVALVLLASVRSHRRDLAVLKTIGFVRRQLTATITWQATALAVLALAIGIPCGIALGRWAWRLVADNVGSTSAAIVPTAAILLAVPATLLAANLLAAAAASTARRVRPREALRAE
jgi:ABC-type antimicrobial peptide transport system permease subunit